METAPASAMTRLPVRWDGPEDTGNIIIKSGWMNSEEAIVG
jgi:hypothetical protein